jgi:hypothetical protein
VGANFNPEIGFTRRRDFNRSFAEPRFSPRPAGIRSVRKFTWSGSGEYIENGAGAVDTREWQGHFITEFESSDQFSIDAARTYEVLRAPFTPAGSPVPIAPGGYPFNNISTAYQFGAHRRVWEYAPGSELFLVYTDERDTTDDDGLSPTAVRGLKNRAFVVKLNRLLRF